MKRSEMRQGAQVIVEVCARVQKGEEVFIVTVESLYSIAQCLAEVVRENKAEPVISVMQTRITDGMEPPATIARGMKASDVFIALVDKSITHTDAVKTAVKNHSRGIMLTQFNETMMTDSGIKADFGAIQQTCKDVAKAMENSHRVVLTSKEGTHLEFSAAGRPGNALTGIVGPGEFAPVPTIEANVSPLEGTANGVIVANASIPYIGIGVLDENVVAHVEDGMITRIEGGKEAEMLRNDLAMKNDPNVYNIAELGVGLNPECRFIGFMLEDEGVYGSVHIGIGTNITLGGVVKAKCHYDLIMTDPTIVADDMLVLKDGEVVLEHC